MIYTSMEQEIQIFYIKSYTDQFYNIEHNSQTEH